MRNVAIMACCKIWGAVFDLLYRVNTPMELEFRFVS